jgi:hypothetical protein
VQRAQAAEVEGYLFMLDNEIIYGLVDENNILINVIVAKEDDFETLEAIKTQENAHAYFVLDQSKVVAEIGQTYWNGSRFLPPKPEDYPSFIWSEDENTWIPPVPKPSESKSWLWNEERVEWVDNLLI